VNDALTQSRGPAVEPAPTDTLSETPMVETRPLWRSIGITVLGLALLVAGSELTVRGAVGIAEALLVPEVIIALTLVAVGTSLPELATCLVAAWRHESDVAIGNIVGSNIFNLLFIYGLTTTVAPAAIPP